MKRFGILLALFLLLGCASVSEKSLDLVKLNEELPLISEDEFDMSNVLASVEYTGENVFGPLEDVYAYDFDDLGIDSENVSHAVVRVSSVSAEMYMVFVPTSGKDELLKEEIHTYLANRIASATSDADKKMLSNALVEENDDFIALIVSNDNEEVLNRILNSKYRLFGALTPITDLELNDYGLTLDMVSEYAIQQPVLTSSTTYLIAKPNEGYEDDVKDAFNSYLKKQEIAFDALPEELEYVKNAMVTELEGYQIVIISKDNEKVFEAIQTYIK